MLQPPVAVRCSVFLSLFSTSLLLTLLPFSLTLPRNHPPSWTPDCGATDTHPVSVYLSLIRRAKGLREREGSGREGGAGRERERENESGREELTHHGNGKWDAAEYRWTLTGMRVRITECHPYSAGLAAVSGQCYRYISIITFSLAAQRSAAFRYTHSATPRCVARPPRRISFASRGPICIATHRMQTRRTAAPPASPIRPARPRLRAV